MKVAYVSTYDASDIGAWSGLAHYIAKALQQQSIDITFVGPLKEYSSYLIKAKQVFYQRIAKQTYHQECAPKVLKYYAEQVTQILENSDVDLVFSPSSIPVCYMKCDKPIVFWTDSTFAAMINFYPGWGWANWCKESLIDSNRMEQAALSNCRMAIYSSEWAANSAITHYDVDASKIKVVPFGANIECNRNLEVIKAMSNRRHKGICKLLFLGVDWYRKGADIAVSVTEELNKQGLKTQLTIVGCDPPFDIPNFVTLKGFISKATCQGRDEIDNLLAESHFLILPSRADCLPVVIAEANSFGVPAVTSNVGGIPTVIKNGENGVALPIEIFVKEACNFIFNSMRNSAVYNQMAESSFDQYQKKINWQTAGRTVRKLLEDICI